MQNSEIDPNSDYARARRSAKRRRKNLSSTRSEANAIVVGQARAHHNNLVSVEKKLASRTVGQRERLRAAPRQFEHRSVGVGSLDEEKKGSEIRQKNVFSHEIVSLYSFFLPFHLLCLNLEGLLVAGCIPLLCDGQAAVSWSNINSINQNKYFALGTRS